MNHLDYKGFKSTRFVGCWMIQGLILLLFIFTGFSPESRMMTIEQLINWSTDVWGYWLLSEFGVKGAKAVAEMKGGKTDG